MRIFSSFALLLGKQKQQWKHLKAYENIIWHHCGTSVTCLKNCCITLTYLKNCCIRLTCLKNFFISVTYGTYLSRNCFTRLIGRGTAALDNYLSEHLQNRARLTCLITVASHLPVRGTASSDLPVKELLHQIYLSRSCWIKPTCLRNFYIRLTCLRNFCVASYITCLIPV